MLAPKIQGTKTVTEATGVYFLREVHAVGERSMIGRRVTERMPGRDRSDYAGMSNDKISENLIRRKPKVSWGRQIRPGLVGT